MALILVGVLWLVLDAAPSRSSIPGECDGELRCDPLLSLWPAVLLAGPVLAAATALVVPGRLSRRVAADLAVLVLLVPFTLALLGKRVRHPAGTASDGSRSRPPAGIHGC